jgi:hypothetical protein
MDGSKFAGNLDMSGLQVEGDLFMRDKAEFAEVEFVGAKVGMNLEMDDSSFKGKLDMNSIQVEGCLFMRNKAAFAEVELVGAKVGGDLDMGSSKFAGKLNMNGLQVEGDLFMDNLMIGSEVTQEDPSNEQPCSKLQGIKVKTNLTALILLWGAPAYLYTFLQLPSLPSPLQ